MPITRERLINSFVEMLQINSTSRHEAGMARLMRRTMTAFGAEVLTDDAAGALGGESGNLICRLPGTAAGPTLMFCAHLDTVESTAELRVQRHQGRISSDGTTILGADDKAGLAAIVEMLHALREDGVPHPPLELVFTVAEEVGLMGSQVMDYSLITAEAGFVPDSTGDVGNIVTQAPAQKHLHVIVHGRSAHAGMAPETGISAITVAAQAIACMRQGRIDGETTANIGKISGGRATNTVPDLVEVEGEARSRNPQKLEEQVAHMRACFLEAAAEAGASAEVVVSDVYPAFHLAEDSLAVTMASRALQTLGIAPNITATGGGSDANFINGYGIPTAILSAGYHGAHGKEEYIDEDQLELLARWLYEIAKGGAADRG